MQPFDYFLKPFFPSKQKQSRLEGKLMASQRFSGQNNGIFYLLVTLFIPVESSFH